MSKCFLNSFQCLPLFYGIIKQSKNAIRISLLSLTKTNFLNHEWYLLSALECLSTQHWSLLAGEGGGAVQDAGPHHHGPGRLDGEHGPGQDQQRQSFRQLRDIRVSKQKISNYHPVTSRHVTVTLRFLNKLSSLQWEENTTKQEMIDEQKIRRAIKKEYDER